MSPTPFAKSIGISCCSSYYPWRRLDMETLSAVYGGIHSSPVDSLHKCPVKRTYDIFVDVGLNKLTNWQTVKLLVIWGTLPLLWRHCNGTILSASGPSLSVDEAFVAIIVLTLVNVWEWRENGYRKISSKRRTKSQNLNDSRLVLHLFCAIYWNQV